ncbi:hypothetical protein EMCRGX_G022549 [Ephydatia muelleri]|eukprot:Em0009g1280a
MTTEGTETTIRVTEPEENTYQDKPVIEPDTASAEPGKATLDPQQADPKYGGFVKKAPFAQRKISEGGRQYFDSGDYQTATGKDRTAIASHPHAMAPEALQAAKVPPKPVAGKAMAERGFPVPTRRAPAERGVSKLASPSKRVSVPSPLAQ